jgi:AraC-like DNA-binding protein
MLAPPTDFTTMRFSGAQIGAPHRFAVWSRLLNKWLLGAGSRALEADAFDAQVQLRVLSEIRFGWGALGASAYERGQGVVAQDNDDLVLLMNLGGSFSASNAGEEIELRTGDAYMMSCSERGSFARPTDGKLLCVRTTRRALAPKIRHLDDRLGSIISRDNEGLSFLSAYLQNSGDSDSLVDTRIASAFAHHVHDLLALSMDTHADVREMARLGGLRAARLDSAKAIIRRNLAEPGLSAEFVARALSMSPRSVQRLFESADTTFSNYVVLERVTRAHALLSDAASGNRSIADIALDCGFGDISYFNRKFREHFDASPSEVRHLERARNAGDLNRRRKRR